jgi:RNase H-fold protein (predicted Holliday junction resolvase)
VAPRTTMAQSLSALAGRRLLAVDPGSRYLGLAVRTCQLAGARRYGLLERTPLRQGGGAPAPSTGGWAWTLRRTEAAAPRQVFDSQAAALAEVLREQRISGVVFGMPYLQDGSRSRESESVRRQVRRLQSEWQAEVPVLLWDESWSTRIATGPQRRRGKLDSQWTHASAACLILQEVLGALQRWEGATNRSHTVHDGHV